MHFFPLGTPDYPSYHPYHHYFDVYRNDIKVDDPNVTEVWEIWNGPETIEEALGELFPEEETQDPEEDVRTVVVYFDGPERDAFVIPNTLEVIYDTDVWTILTTDGPVQFNADHVVYVDERRFQ